MIALDTSSLIAYLSGGGGEDVEKVDFVLEHKQAVLPPVVLSELLSDSHLPPRIQKLIDSLPLLEITGGYWERVGFLRARLLGRGFKAKLADCLIAGSCIDHEVPLVTRDRDFRHFARVGGLKLF